MPSKEATPKGAPFKFDAVVTERLKALGAAKQDVRARKVADDYQVTTERINPLIERAEKALAALRLGVSASVSIHPNIEDGWVEALCFGKVGNEWALTVDTGHVSAEDSWKSTRLTATSRSTRIKCLGLLSKLEQALIERAESELQEAGSAIAAAELYLADLESRTK